MKLFIERYIDPKEIRTWTSLSGSNVSVVEMKDGAKYTVSNTNEEITENMNNFLKDTA